jgi:tripartite-type tricarboxylate transporter receptor subunit TctC
MKASKSKLDVRAGAVMWATLCIFLCRPSQALPQELFYQGKTITVISGRDPGGLGDLRHRVIIPYLKKHIPGQPNIVTEYMPGGGGRKVANHIYLTAQPDGLTMGSPPGGFILAAVLKEPGVNYELDNLRTSALPSPRITTCFSREKRPIWARWTVSAPLPE